MNLEYYVGSFLMYTLSHHHHNKHDFVPSSLRDMYPNYVLQSQSLPTQREDESWMMNVFRRPNPRINFDSDLELSISSFGFSDIRTVYAISQATSVTLVKLRQFEHHTERCINGLTVSLVNYTV